MAAIQILVKQITSFKVDSKKDFFKIYIAKTLDYFTHLTKNQILTKINNLHITKILKIQVFYNSYIYNGRSFGFLSQLLNFYLLEDGD